MKKSIFFKDKSIIGLEISYTGLKAMAIKQSTWSVEAYGALDLDPAKMQATFDVADDEYLTENLKKLFSDHIIGSLPSNHVAIGIPTSKTFTRTFAVPIKQKKKLAEAVELEVTQYIPMPISTLYIDYDIISSTKEELTIALSAAPRTLVDKCLTAAKNANLRPVAVEPNINGVSRVLQATEKAHLSTLIVDISQANTDIAVFDLGAIQVSGGTAVGGNTFTIDIAKTLKIPLENAHQLKIINGLNSSENQDSIKEALTPALEKITAEIKKVLRYYTERLDNNKIEQIIIIGAGSNIPGIGEYFTDSLVMPVRVANPWQELNFDTLEQPPKQFRPRYIGVAGLAGIDPLEVLS